MPKVTDQLEEAGWVESIRKIIVSISSTMLGLSVEVPCDCESPVGEHLAATVDIAGQWSGTVLVEGDAAMAAAIAHALFGVAVAELTTVELKDAMGELANMIGGNLMPLIPGAESLSLPATTVAACGFKSAQGSNILAMLPIRIGGHPMRISLLRTGESDAGRQCTSASESGAVLCSGRATP